MGPRDPGQGGVHWTQSSPPPQAAPGAGPGSRRWDMPEKGLQSESQRLFLQGSAHLEASRPLPTPLLLSGHRGSRESAGHVMGPGSLPLGGPQQVLVPPVLSTLTGGPAGLCRSLSAPSPGLPRCPLACSPSEEAPAGPARQPVWVQSPAAQLHSETGQP